MGRTALHYAGGRSDAGHYYRILTDAGADEEIKDLVCHREFFECREILHSFLLSADFFQSLLLKKNSFRNTIRVSNRLDSEQARHFVEPDLDQVCFQRLSADDNLDLAIG